VIECEVPNFQIDSDPFDTRVELGPDKWVWIPPGQVTGPNV